MPSNLEYISAYNMDNTLLFYNNIYLLLVFKICKQCNNLVIKGSV